MKTVPDIVQYVKTETCQQEKRQEQISGLFLKGILAVHDIQRHEHQHSNTAVNVRPVIQSNLRIHRHKVSGNHLEDGEITLHLCRKCGISGCGQTEGIYFRHKDDGCQPSGKQRVQNESSKLSEDLACGLIFLRQNQNEEIQHEEHAGHDGNIVVGQDRKSQCNTVQKRLLFENKAFQTQHDDWEDQDAVHPHNVPAVSGQIAGKRIKNTEEADGKMLRPAMLSEIPGKCQSAKTDFYDNQICHKFNHAGLGNDQQHPVDRARQIIGVQRRKVRACTDVPGIEQAVTGGELCAELLKEGGVLMIQVRPQETGISKGIPLPINTKIITRTGTKNDRANAPL